MLYEFAIFRFGKQAALDLGCLGLDLEVTNATVDCLREKSILALLSMEIVNELMTQPCIGNDNMCQYGFNCLSSKDGGHTTQPYLPLEPEIAITSGQYASEVDILLGLSIILICSPFSVKGLWRMKL